MDLEYQVSPSAFTEDFVVRIWEAQSDGPSGWVYETTLVEKNALGVPTPGAGHQVIETLMVSGLDFVTHILRMYGVTSGTLYHFYEHKARKDTYTVYSPIQFKIGDDGDHTPAIGDIIYENPLLQDLGDDDYTVFRNNYGFLHPNLHYQTDGPNARFELIGDDGTSTDQFNDLEEFTIQRKPKQLTEFVNDSVVGKWVGGFVDVNAHTVYDPAHLRKLLRFNGTVNYTFPLAATIPIGYGFVFQNFGSVNGIGTVNFSNGTLLWAGSPKTSLAIPRYCEACFIWDGTNWNVVYITQSTFVNGGTGPVAGEIIMAGQTVLGDVPAGDPTYTITHNQAIVGDYVVFLSIQSNSAATYSRDNKLGYCWFHHATDKPNKFIASLQELSPESQNVTLVWMLVKL